LYKVENTVLQVLVCTCEILLTHVVVCFKYSLLTCKIRLSTWTVGQVASAVLS